MTIASAKFGPEGAGIGKGYYQREEQTASTFQATLADNSDKTYLRTGDLGFIRDGELYITGRIKDMMILWGDAIIIPNTSKKQ